MTEQKPCFSCEHARASGGDCHIGCMKSPEAIVLVGAGGDERFKIAQNVVDDALKHNLRLAVRCVWDGSGLFPSLFDGLTVFACGNWEKRQGDMIQTNQFLRLAEDIKRGVPPVIGQIKLEAS